MIAREIPIEEALRIAQEYGYDQIVILARKTGDNGMEHVTSHGTSPAHANVAARVAYFLKYRLMNWPIRSAAPSESRPPATPNEAS